MNTRQWTALLCALVTMLTLNGQSDSRQIVVIQPGQTTEKVTFDQFLEVDLAIDHDDDRDGARVNLKFTNRGYGNDYAHDLVVFDRPYYKSDLDDKRPKYVLKKGVYKSFNAKNSAERVLYLSIEGQQRQVANRIMMLRTGMDGEHVEGVFTKYDQPLVLVIPAYVVAKANEKKVEIISHVVCTLDLTVKRPKPKRDPVLEKLREDFRDVDNRIDNADFCPSKRHKPSLKEQKAPYWRQLEDINEKIAQARPAADDYTRSYQGYLDLKHSVDSLLECLDKVKGTVCGSCDRKSPPPSLKHSCAYCGSNIEKELMIMATKAKRGEKLSSGELRKAQGLYNCARARGKTGKSVNDYYNTIKNAKTKPKPDPEPIPIRHSCSHCGSDIEKQLMKLATKASRGTALSSADRAQAKALYDCAKARGKVNSSISKYYNRINAK